MAATPRRTITRRGMLKGAGAAIATLWLGDSDQPLYQRLFEKATADKRERQAYLDARIHAIRSYSGARGLPVIDPSRLLLAEYIDSRAEAEWFIRERTANDGSFLTLLDGDDDMQAFPAVVENDRYRLAPPVRGVQRQTVLVAKPTAYISSSPEEFDSALVHEFAHAAQFWDGTFHFTNAFSLYDLIELDFGRMPDDAASFYGSSFRMNITEFDGYAVQHRFAERFPRNTGLIKGTRALASSYQARFLETAATFNQDVLFHPSTVPEGTVQLFEQAVREMTRSREQMG